MNARLESRVLKSRADAPPPTPANAWPTWKKVAWFLCAAACWITGSLAAMTLILAALGASPIGGNP